MISREAGERFPYEGKWYLVEKDIRSCPVCAFLGNRCVSAMDVRGECASEYRHDAQNVVFKAADYAA